VLKNIGSVIAKTNAEEGTAELASLSIDDDSVPELTPKTSKASSKRPSPLPSEISLKGPLPQESEVHTKVPHSSGSNPKMLSVPLTEPKPKKKTLPRPSVPAKEEPSHHAIGSHEEYLSCRSRFEQMYPRYSTIDIRLKEVAAEFNSMAVKLDSPQCPSTERKRIQHQVKELYAQLKPEVDQLKLEFNTMHEEMAMLKSRIRNYVDTVLTPF
jgi:hypothetical protein